MYKKITADVLKVNVGRRLGFIATPKTWVRDKEGHLIYVSGVSFKSEDNALYDLRIDLFLKTGEIYDLIT